MFKIQTMNNIAEAGLEVLEKRGCEVGPETSDPNGILLRSADLHGMAFGDALLAIARAGAGTNNIPVADCTERGIVVFNAPGANAEGVKELELCSLVMSSRDVLGSIAYVRSIAGEGEEIEARREEQEELRRTRAARQDARRPGSRRHRRADRQRRRRNRHAGLRL